MAISDILLIGNPLLYKKSEDVLKEEIKDLLPKIDLMFETIADFRQNYGVGRAIAAPQIGLLKRIICFNTDKKVAMINPVLENLSEEMFEVWDDCMSFPNLLVKVLRHRKITIRFLNLNFEEEIWHLEDDLAELMQHEFDHLNGILATQRAINNQSFRWKI